MSVKVAIAQINATVGDSTGNHRKILDAVTKAVDQGADLVLTPEFSLMGYPPEDLLLRPAFLERAQAQLLSLARDLAGFTDVHVIVGHPAVEDGQRYNAASVLCNGNIVATYYKSELPNDGVFDEKRYFEAGHVPCVFTVKGVQFGINICEDVWHADAPRRARDAGAEVMLVLNGSPYHIGKQALREAVLCENIASLGLPSVFANLVGGQDELVFDGASFVMDAAGKVVVRLPFAEEAVHVITFEGNVPVQQALGPLQTEEAQVYAALVLAVRDYVTKNGFPGILLGLSGGVDSALVLAIAVDALGVEKVRAIMMPSPYTAEISKIDSRDMVARLGVRYDELDIVPCFDAFKATLATEFAGLKEDTTEENIQARIRGTLLMAMSNKYGSIVLTTGNKSEMAVGYCTLYGDMAGGFAVLRDVPKMLVYRLCQYRNSVSPVIPERIITRPPSAELRPDQKDQDSLPPYEVLDAIVQMAMEENRSAADIVAAGYAQQDVERVLRLLRINEYKRRQAAVGPRITSRGFGRDWRMPITSGYREQV